MQKRYRNLLAISMMIMLACVLTVPAFAQGDETETYVSNMYGTFWALVPPLIAIILALVTKEVFSSLFVGILAGALFYSNFRPVMTLNTIINDGFIGGVADRGNVGIFMFLILLGVLVALMNQSGGSAAFGRWAETHVKTRSGAMLATFVLGILIFVDDYFNCLTVGSVMRPFCDTHRISRAKLAYLIDATAAPVCMIAPISSWAAAVSGMVPADAMNSMELFVRAIPYNFYSLLTFAFILAIILMNVDYGPMKLREMNAKLNGQLGGIDSGEKIVIHPRGRVIDLILPVLFLIISCVIGMIYVGGFFEGESFINAFANTNPSVGLPWGSLIALVLTIIYLVARRVISFKDAMQCLPKGFIAMVPAILILTFAITLKTMTGMLGAGDYVAELMDSAAARLANFLPAVIFIVACFLSFSTGTSWGTFGILIPIVVDIFPVGSELLIVGVSACLAGAVCGDHCSPISDTTIMSSAGAQCNHVEHVSTQLPYAVTVAAISFICYIVAGFIQNALICLALGMILTVGTIAIIRSIQNR
ncbi:MAG: Na+/H+ antiporter NhaC family protein [Oscillospiraceae bacterium]